MRSNVLRMLCFAVVLLAATPASAGAALKLGGVTVGAQAAFVRVVVTFTGEKVNLTQVQATDAKPADGVAAVEIEHPGVSVSADDVSGTGIRAVLSLAGSGRATVRMTGTAGKFKYLRISAVTAKAPQRLVLDLYRTAPPSTKAEIMTGPGGCLALTTVQGSGTSFKIKGTEHNVFEGSFVLRVRDMTGRVVGTHVMTARGAWSQTMSYKVSKAQPGTVEAVASSAKDGSVACLVQVRVALAT